MEDTGDDDYNDYDGYDDVDYDDDNDDDDAKSQPRSTSHARWIQVIFQSGCFACFDQRNYQTNSRHLYSVNSECGVVTGLDDDDHNHQHHPHPHNIYHHIHHNLFSRHLYSVNSESGVVTGLDGAIQRLVVNGDAWTNIASR